MFGIPLFCWNWELFIESIVDKILTTVGDASKENKMYEKY